MKTINPVGLLIRAFLLSLTVILLGACATFPYLNMTYRLPLRTEAIKGRVVSLEVEDGRSSASILGPGAQNELEGFSGGISLAVARGTEPGVHLGVYDVPFLVKQALKSRMEDSGVEITTEMKAGQTVLSVRINEFFLDLADRTWRFRMGYEARIVRNGNILATQTVRGQAERMKVIGRDQADQVVEEGFTDTINQLNMVRLLQQAGL